jgi:hypothetical protein
MKIITLDGKILKLVINPRDYQMKDETVCRSQFQYRVGQFLRKKYKLSTILEEWPIPESNLSLDFLILLPELLAVECDGRQHHEYVEFYHKNRLGFANQVQRDNQKDRFCTLNAIKLIRVKESDNLEQLF